MDSRKERLVQAGVREAMAPSPSTSGTVQASKSLDSHKIRWQSSWQGAVAQTTRRQKDREGVKDKDKRNPSCFSWATYQNVPCQTN